MNATGPSAPRRGEVSISSRPEISRRSSVSARFGTSKQTWWNPSPFEFEEARHARRVIGRFDQLDFRLADGQERDAHPVAGDVHDGLELEVQHIAPEGERRIDGADDQRDVMDLADVADGLGQAAGGRSHEVFLHADAP